MKKIHDASEQMVMVLCVCDRREVLSGASRGTYIFVSCTMEVHAHVVVAGTNFSSVLTIRRAVVSLPNSLSHATETYAFSPSLMRK